MGCTKVWMACYGIWTRFSDRRVRVRDILEGYTGEGIGTVNSGSTGPGRSGSLVAVVRQPGWSRSKASLSDQIRTARSHRAEWLFIRNRNTLCSELYGYSNEGSLFSSALAERENGDGEHLCWDGD